MSCILFVLGNFQILISLGNFFWWLSIIVHNMRMRPINFTHHFLMAMPGMQETTFSHSVVYIFLHDESGAVGIVVNKPLDITFGDALQDMELGVLEPSIRKLPVHNGGPIRSNHGFVLRGHKCDVKDQYDRLDIAASRENFQSILSGATADDVFIATGYAAWSVGQLEKEMQENLWLSNPADANIIFNIPAEQRWHAAFMSLGVNLSQLSPSIGHA